jgi:hypothetical protein
MTNMHTLFNLKRVSSPHSRVLGLPFISARARGVFSSSNMIFSPSLHPISSSHRLSIDLYIRQSIDISFVFLMCWCFYHLLSL